MNTKTKKPFYKRWWFILIVIVVVLGIIGSALDDGEEEAEKTTEKTTDTGVVETEKPKPEEVDKVDDDVSQDEGQEEESPEEDNESDVTWDDLKDKDRIIGKSDKSFKDAANAKPGKVRNDVTGNWRLTRISESIPIEEYALSYYEEYMEEDEVHFIVNFNYNTTTWLNKMGGLLYVEIREYVSKEEHDAKKLGGGMTLASYVIYPDGDIQELKDE